MLTNDQIIFAQYLAFIHYLTAVNNKKNVIAASHSGHKSINAERNTEMLKYAI